MPYSFLEISFDQNTKEIIELWERAYNRELSPEMARWIFKPYSKNKIYAALSKSNKIVGIYCLLELTAIVEDKEQRVYLCNNVCVSPEERGKNIFTRLGQYAVLDILPQSDFIFGFPNAQALDGHRKVQWDFHPPLRVYSADAFDCSNRHFDKLTFADFDSVAFRDFENNSDFYSKNTVFVLKNKLFFKWRYLDRPCWDREYLIKFIVISGIVSGYIVFSVRRAANIVHIIDVCSSDASILPFCLDYGREVALENGLKRCSILGSSVPVRYLERADYQSTDQTFTLITKSVYSKYSLDGPIWSRFVAHFSDFDVF